MSDITVTVFGDEMKPTHMIVGSSRDVADFLSILQSNMENPLSVAALLGVKLDES